jgi:malate dehydrogenase (oxaloacetate-decarboxylating)(NADP+)
VQQVVDEGIAKPILIGRPKVIQKRLDGLGLRLKAGEDFELVNPHSDPRYRRYWGLYHEIMGRRGVTPSDARTVVRTNNTVIAGLMLRHGDADAMLCGVEGGFRFHLQHVQDVIGKGEGIHDLSTLSALVLPSGTFFICDSHVTPDPTAEEIAEMTLLSAMEVRRFGVEPKVALLSHSNFGSHDTASAAKMRKALRILRSRSPRLEVDGEMHADTALAEDIRERVLPNTRLSGRANLLVMPNLDAAHITYAALKVLGGGVSIGPILIGVAKPAHVVTNSITVRGLVNMTAMAVVGASVRAKEQVALA